MIPDMIMGWLVPCGITFAGGVVLFELILLVAGQDQQRRNRRYLDEDIDT